NQASLGTAANSSPEGIAGRLTANVMPTTRNATPTPISAAWNGDCSERPIAPCSAAITGINTPASADQPTYSSNVSIFMRHPFAMGMNGAPPRPAQPVNCEMAWRVDALEAGLELRAQGHANPATGHRRDVLEGRGMIADVAVRQVEPFDDQIDTRRHRNRGAEVDCGPAVGRKFESRDAMLVIRPAHLQARIDDSSLALDAQRRRYGRNAREMFAIIQLAAHNVHRTVQTPVDAERRPEIERCRQFAAGKGGVRLSGLEHGQSVLLDSSRIQVDEISEGESIDRKTQLQRPGLPARAAFDADAGLRVQRGITDLELPGGEV